LPLPGKNFGLSGGSSALSGLLRDPQGFLDADVDGVGGEDEVVSGADAVHGAVACLPPA
jgi:hypothetical protein